MAVFVQRSLLRCENTQGCVELPTGVHVTNSCNLRICPVSRSPQERASIETNAQISVVRLRFQHCISMREKEGESRKRGDMLSGCVIPYCRPVAVVPLPSVRRFVVVHASLLQRRSKRPCG